MRSSSRRSTGHPDLSSRSWVEAVAPSKIAEQLGQRVVVRPAPVVDQVEADLARVLVDPRQRDYPACVHDGRVEACFDALVEEHRVQDVTGGGIQTERDVRKSEDRGDAGELRLDRLDPLDGLDAVAPAFLHAGRQAEAPADRTAGLQARGRSDRRQGRVSPVRPGASILPSSPDPLCRCTCTRPLHRARGRATRRCRAACRDRLLLRG